MRVDPQLRMAVVTAALLGAGLWLAACRGRDPYRIGIALGAEGTLAATLAAEELNGSAGTDGRRVELDVDTDAYDANASKALAAAQRFADDPELLAVVGHANSAASLAASQVYNAARLVQIAPTTTAPLFGHAGPYSFRLVGSDVHQARYLAQQVLAQPSHARIAIAFVNDDYGRALHRLVLGELRRMQIMPVFDSPYSENLRVDPQIASAMALARPVLLVWLGRASQYWVMQPGIRTTMPNLRVIASDGFGGRILVQDTQHRYRGVQYVRLVDVSGQDPRLVTFRERFVAAGGGPLTDQAVLAYDAVMLIGESVRQGATTRNAVREWMASLGHARAAYMGVTGPVAFSTTGERPTAYAMEVVP